MSTSVGTISLDLTLNNRIEEQINKITKGIANKFSGSMGAVNTKLEKTVSKPFENMQRTAEKSTSKVKSSMAQIQNTANQTSEKVDETFKNATNNISNSFKSTAADSKKYFDELRDNEQKLLEQLSKPIDIPIADPNEKLKTVELKKSSTAMPVPSFNDLDNYADINTKGTIEEIEQQLEGMKSKGSETVNKINSEFENSIKRFTKAYDSADEPIDRLNQKLELQLSKLEADQKAVAKLGKAYSEINVKELGNEEALKLEQALMRAESQVLRDKDAIDKLNVQIKKVSNSAGDAVKNKLSRQINTATSSARKIPGVFSKIKSAVSKVGNAGKTAFSKLRSHLKSTDKSARTTNGLFSKMGKTIKGVFKATFITAGLYAAFRGLKSLFADAMSQSSEFQKSLNNLKANFKIAFQPVISTVMPILTKLINKLSQVMASVASFISGVFGSTYDQSKQAAKQASQTAKKSSEEAQKYLNSYDVVNKAQDTNKDKSSDSDDSGVDFDAVDTKGSKAAEKLGAKFKKIMSELFTPIKNAWAKHGQPVMDSIKTTAGKIKTLFVDIGKDFKAVWTDGTGERYVSSILKLVQNVVTAIGKIAGAFDKAWNKGSKGKKLIKSLFDTSTKISDMWTAISDSVGKAFDSPAGVTFFSNILGIITNISDFVGNLAEQFTKAWEKAGLGDAIMRNLLNLVNSITGFIERITGSLAKWSSGLDFTPLLTGINTLLEAFTGLSDAVGGVLGDAFEAVLLPLASWTIEEAGPTALETFSGLLDALGTIINTIRPGLQTFYDKVLKPIGSWAGSVVIEALGKLKNLFSTVAGVFKEKGSEIKKVISAISDVISRVWKYIKPTLTAIKDFVFGIFDNLISTVKGVVSGVIDWLSGIIDFLKDVFKGDWKAAWNDIKKIVKGVWDTIWSVIKGIINTIIDGINLLWKGIYRAISGIINCVGKVAGVIGDLFGKDWHFEMPENPPTIPKLAKGGLATAPTLAMVGDNKNAKSDPEVIAPLSKLKGMLDEGSSDSEIVALLKEILALLKGMKFVFNGSIDKDVLYRCIVELNKSNTNRTGVNALI